MNRLLQIILLFFSLIFSVRSSEAKPVLLCGPAEQTGEFAQIYRHAGITVEQAENWAKLPDFTVDNYSAVLFCHDNWPKIPEIPAELSQKIEHFLRSGGNVYLECCRNFPLPDIEIGNEAVLMQDERLLTIDSSFTDFQLEAETLLEEQNSYAQKLVINSDSAATLLDYGVYLGTYKRWQVPLNDAYELVFTWPEIQKIAVFKQYYGGLEKNYCPDRVEIWSNEQLITSATAKDLSSDGLLVLNMPADFSTRQIKIKIFKHQTGPGTDFLVLNSLAFLTDNQQNISDGMEYEFYAKGIKRPLHAGTLTKFRPVESWNLDRDYILASGSSLNLNQAVMPGLIRLNYGKGTLYYAATPLSRFRLDHYRLTANWDKLLKSLACKLLPPADAELAGQTFLPLQIRTSPRRWTTPGNRIKLFINAPADSQISITAPVEFMEHSSIDGVRCFVAENVPEFTENIVISAKNDSGGYEEKTIPYTVMKRKDYYRQVLERNMQWYLDSGVLIAPDGSQGIRNTVEIGAFRGGVAEKSISSPRVDTQLFAARTFYLYYLVSGKSEWRERALNLADYALKLQNTAPHDVMYGAWPWLVSGNRGFYPQDDHSRIIENYAFLYGQTKNPAYWQAAVRALELINSTANEDGTVTYWCCALPEQFAAAGRAGMRTIYDTNCSYWSLYRLDSGFRLLPFEKYYADHIETLIRAYLPLETGGWESLNSMGLAIAAKHINKLPAEYQTLLKQRLEAYAQRWQNSAEIDEYGYFVQHNQLHNADLERVYVNDSAIHTLAGEPISDQLYGTSSEIYWLYTMMVHSDSETVTQAAELMADFLAGIQTEDDDKRLNGCWFRGYDMANNECFGTRYDANYGAYHAYVGWTNTRIASTLAYYILAADPLENYFTPEETLNPPVQLTQMYQQILTEGDFNHDAEQNLLHNAKWSALPAPVAGTLNMLSESKIAGHWKFDPQVEFAVPESGKITLTAALPAPVAANYFTVRAGGMTTEFAPIHMQLYNNKQLILDAPLTAPNGSNQFKLPQEYQLENITIELSCAPSAAKIFLGNIRLLNLKQNKDSMTNKTEL